MVYLIVRYIVHVFILCSDVTLNVANCHLTVVIWYIYLQHTPTLALYYTRYNTEYH